MQSSQRQAAVRGAWSAGQRAAGRTLWQTPSVLTFTQFAERQLTQHWADANLPDRLLPSGAEWALLRGLRAEGGMAEARALLQSVRTLQDWGMTRSAAVLGGSAEGERLLEALKALEAQSRELDRRPLRGWLAELTPAAGELRSVGLESLPPVPAAALGRIGARAVERSSAARSPVSMAAARDDDHEIALIAGWCRGHLEQDPARRLLIVDSKLRQRRRQYERVLAQALEPGEWLSSKARAFSTVFAIEGGQPLTDFPLITHALLSLRLLTGMLRFDELLLWLRMPFLDTDDVFAGAAIEAALRDGYRLEYDASALADFLERAPGDAPRALATRLRDARVALGDGRRAASDWARRLLAALRALGWHGTRPLRSDEQQTVARLHALLDEFSALGAWLPATSAPDAVAIFSDLARERSFDPASVVAPVTLTDSHEDPVVSYDGIWVAGLDAAQWPPAPRPDVFIPLPIQVAAGIPAASAAGQAREATRSLEYWRAATSGLVCSWARLDGDAHRTPSPLLVKIAEQTDYCRHGAKHRAYSAPALAQQVRRPQLEPIEDVLGDPVAVDVPVLGGVRPLTLQAECGFRAYGEMRLRADPLEAPAPGIDPRDRGMLLHKALELVWLKLKDWFSLKPLDAQLRKPIIHQAVEAAEVFVYRGFVPPDVRPAVGREKLRLERLIENLLLRESRRPAFVVEQLEARRQVDIAGGLFDVRIDRIDSIEGGGFAILDYKSGDSAAPRWDGDSVRDPQLLAYLLAEQGRDVQVLANVSLTRGRARFVGKASRKGLLPGVNGVKGLSPDKVDAGEIAAVWQRELETWRQGLTLVAAAYLAGEAPVQPGSDVCRHCHLTVLCRRVELAAAELAVSDPAVSEQAVSEGAVFEPGTDVHE